MRSLCIILACFVCCPFLASGQRYEIGIFGGAANYVGDLAPDPVLSESNPAIGLMLKRNFTDYVSAGLAVNFGKISGDDKNFDNLAPRNLNFYSNILEFSPQIEFNFFRFTLGQSNFRYTSKTVRFTPYIFTGISVFRFNPKTTYEDQVYELQPLSTEGQGVVDGAPKPYGLWQVAIPFGGGFKYNISDKLNIILSLGYRTTFTDYLDDVSGNYTDINVLAREKGVVAAALADRSGEETGTAYRGRPGYQRGIADTDDWYLFTGVTLSYIVPGRICYKFGKPGFL